MQPGRLNRKVQIQSLGASQDAFGQLVQTWSLVATVWAAIAPKTGRELVAAAAAASEVSVTISIRYRAGITPQMRIVFGSIIYNIVAVIDRDDAHKYLDIECTVGVNNG